MAEINRAVRGTNDVLPEESYRWQYVERAMLDTARLFGFREIRVPVFEHTEVFTRSVGDTTDVVQKEMYTFDDKGGRSITLRPEWTAGVIRSMIEKGLVNGPLPVKACYIGGCYRYEKPQAGRLREFHQFGIECVGAGAPSADAEVIALAHHLLTHLGVKAFQLQLNSIGCPECRGRYHQALTEYFTARKDELCGTCQDRLLRNPMRILDCKSPVCHEIAAAAPVMLDFLCDDCRAHFEEVKRHLSAAGIDFSVNPHIVRGLDYYTRTVFEFVSDCLGAQSTVCGGGRYDGLIAQMGGPALPALGFGMGIERLLMILEAQHCPIPAEAPCDLYIASMGEAASIEATRLATQLRDEGFSCLTDITGRGLKAQMRYANKVGAKYTMVLGESELAAKNATLKCMATGQETPVALPDGLLKALYDLPRDEALASLTEAVERLN